MVALHQQLAAGRWFSLSLVEQLGNIGSEYERACRHKERGDNEHFYSSLQRFLELLDLTIADPRWHNHRLKELCRLREQSCEELLGSNQDSLWSLKEYFLQFAIAARQ